MGGGQEGGGRRRKGGGRERRGAGSGWDREGGSEEYGSAQHRESVHPPLKNNAMW